MKKREIYLDNAATTRVDEAAAKTALEIMTEAYGNPSSLHKKGLEAQLRLEEARAGVTSALGCEKDELVFTSGGTEANNIAIFGAAEAKKRAGNTVVATAWEHSSVLEPVRELGRRGFTVKLVKPEPDGRIDIDRIADEVDSDTVLVSCMMVNSEVGAVADIAGLVKKVRRKAPNALIHCDAVQAFGKLKFSASKLGADLLSVSGHKIHAPKGVGALYIRKAVRVLPLSYGGGQEQSLRPGTQALPLITAFGVAAETAAGNIAANLDHVGKLSEYFVNKASTIGGLCMNSPAEATPYICNVSVTGFRSEIMLHYLAAKGIYVSSGSACSAGKPSHVLAAMNLPRERADSALRVSFCKHNSLADVDAFFDALSQGLKEIRI